MTLEQRQAFEQERTQAMQAAAAACEGKAQGEACVVQNARDGSARSGTCESRNASNGTLACLVARLNLPNG